MEKSNPKSVYEKEEIFGPNVCFYSTDDLSEAFALANNTSYGLAAAIFTKDESKYAQALSELDTGLVNWNRATCGASSKLPFGGTKKSGNNRPTAHHAVYYCTIPVASLEDSNDFDPQKIAPGVSLK